jgi:lipid-A-disaccharide synthase
MTLSRAQNSQNLTACGIFIFAGESSADLHGEALLKALFAQNPHLQIEGVGGPKMRAQGLRCILPMEKFQVMGFVDVFLALPRLIRQFYFVAKAIRSANPQAVLFIDYPGFNLRMANHLRKKGYKGKLCHYICPSVWAWGKKRIPSMAKNLDLLLTILPFEKKYFEKTPLTVHFVGHPLVERLSNHPYQTLNLPKGRRIVGLFPGSRTKEIERNLPLQLKVAKRLSKECPDLFFAISISHNRFLPLIEKILHEEQLDDTTLIPPDRAYDLMQACHIAIAKSGTVNLELALHSIPTIVHYAISSLDLFLATKILRINLPYYCLVNIIENREVFPELYGPKCTEENLVAASLRFLNDPILYTECKERCQQIQNKLGQTKASTEATTLILEAVHGLL